MTDHELRIKFYRDIYPSRPNEWEVEDLFESLDELETAGRGLLLAQVPAIWPVSHTLCFEFLRAGGDILELIQAELIPEFVRQLLSVYEKRGLQGTRELTRNIDRLFLAPLRGETDVAFESVATRLLHFIRGVSGKSLQLGCDKLPSTDTETVFLPSWVGVFPQRTDNEWLYRVLVTLQWSHIVRGIYSLPADGGIVVPWQGFADQALAKDLYAFKQLFSGWQHLCRELPGLAAGKDKILERLVPGTVSPRESEVKSLRQELLDNFLLAIFEAPGTGSSAVISPEWSLADLYQTVASASGDYCFSDAAMLLIGEFDFHRACEKIAILRAERKSKFVQLAALFLNSYADKDGEKTAVELSSTSDSAAVVLKEMLEDQQEGSTKTKRNSFDNVAVALSDELLELARAILDDIKSIPDSYFQAAAGLAGGGVNRQQGGATDDEQLVISPRTWLYDEWDYRRDGYRNDWCVVYEKSLNEVRSDFVQKTLQKYDVPLRRLRRQFEALRIRQRFMRRQRDGDEIDIDAMVDSLGDSSAGYSPSERLFVKLLRDDRDITTLFLVDMSNSTEGWVGVALKEALVLLAEALEAAQDRYGIYGFSGMRRSRSEVYAIKAPDENYSSVIQRRIAGIMPMEYTRMGPAIRHSCRELAREQSRIRILIVLSDGKPEDYDDYKGQYAIEDTRKALLEARGSGIFVFCITIDRTAHDYLEHMFGRGNYIFVEDLSRLPEKMAEMYRLLTS